jgi:prepilin-type N-terminal cleavage/methylation domain-containing protein
MERGVNSNNKGFTLIETIVAMTILVLVSIPLMDTFSRSLVMTRNSSSYQRAVLLGQSVTEGVKAHSVGDLCLTFVKPDKYHFDILDDNTFDYTGYERLKKTAISGDTFQTYPGQPATTNDRIYYYGIYGVSNGSRTYDALIELDSEKYNDINSRIIPTIVNMGSKSTAVIDNTGQLNNMDNLAQVAYNDMGYPSDMTCEMSIFIKRYDPNGVSKGGYYIYANVKYSSASKGTSRTYKHIGDKAFDNINKLKYVYVICNADKLYGKVDNKIKINIDVQGIGDDVNIPIAMVSSNTNANRGWYLDTPTGANWRKYLQFLTNDGETGITNIYTVQPAFGDNRGNLGDSGQKIRRLYNLKVKVYEAQPSLDKRFIGDPISETNSAFIR